MSLLSIQRSECGTAASAVAGDLDVLGGEDRGADLAHLTCSLTQSLALSLTRLLRKAPQKNSRHIIGDRHNCTRGQA